MKNYLIILSLLYLFVPFLDAMPQQSGSLSKVLNKKSKKDTLVKPKSGTLKNIPSEVTSVGGEAKNVMEEIDQVLKNIQSILGTA